MIDSPITLERESSPAVEQTFGKYELLERLGRGMADVYLAYHPDLNRRVVLKIIERSASESNRLAIEAERRGAELQRKLHGRDKRVLEIYETGELAGCFFVAMQYFPGRTIAEILRAERAIEARRAARLAAEICSQLRTLHGYLSTPQQKTAVVHGDIKPSNIQVGAHDELRLLDFGIAKLIRAGHDLTQHQLGSPSYCSPERLRNSQVDVHSDLWALAVTLYEMVAGVPPFQASDTRELERLIQSRKAAFVLPANCPPRLKAIVLKGLAADIKKRYRSAAEFESDLQAFLAAQTAPRRISIQTTVVRPKPVPQKTPARKHVSRGTLAIALLAGLLAGVLLLIPATYYFQAKRLSHAIAAPKDYIQSDPGVLARDWMLYQSLKNKSSLERQFLNTPEIEKTLNRNLVNSAGGLITRFRQASSAAIPRAEWQQAKRCLLDALSLEPKNRKSLGELHFVNGYLARCGFSTRCRTRCSCSPAASDDDEALPVSRCGDPLPAWLSEDWPGPEMQARIAKLSPSTARKLRRHARSFPLRACGVGHGPASCIRSSTSIFPFCHCEEPAGGRSECRAASATYVTRLLRGACPRAAHRADPGAGNDISLGILRISGSAN